MAWQQFDQWMQDDASHSSCTLAFDAVRCLYIVLLNACGAADQAASQAWVRDICYQVTAVLGGLDVSLAIHGSEPPSIATYR